MSDCAYVPETGQDALQDWRCNFRPILCLRSNHESLALGGIQGWRIRWTLGEEICEQLRNLIRVEIRMVERRMLTEREDGILEVHAYHGRRLGGELPARRRGNDGGREDEPLQRPQADPVRKPD